ncbi:hypothetical protein C0J52_17562 [Blattella germanica]|nr:hypothetical protein C0J52_17562 [Blattella germanica]
MLAQSQPDTQNATDDIYSQEHENVITWGRLFSVRARIMSLDLTEEEYTVGRSNKCSVIFTNNEVKESVLSTISKLHFRIIKEQPSKGITEVYLEDFSSNGTFVNNENVGKGKRRILRNNDQISLASPQYKVYVYRFMGSCDDNNSYPEEIRSKYIVTRELGAGACGKVYLVFDKKCRRYAMKIIQKKRFDTRANNVPSSDKPCVIRVEDIVDTPDALYIILELMEGGELFDRIKSSQQLNEPQAKLIFYQIALAVKHLHDNKITHRDLKPENILLASDKEETIVKVSDFGLSKFINCQSMLKTFCGTPLYVAPEILETKGMGYYTEKVDIWSLGVILGAYGFHTKYWHHVSTEAVDLIKKMLTVDPKKRISIDTVLHHKWLKDEAIKEIVNELIREDNRNKDRDLSDVGSPRAKRPRIDINEDTSDSSNICTYTSAARLYNPPLLFHQYSKSIKIQVASFIREIKFFQIHGITPVSEIMAIGPTFDQICERNFIDINEMTKIGWKIQSKSTKKYCHWKSKLKSLFMILAGNLMLKLYKDIYAKIAENDVNGLKNILLHQKMKVDIFDENGMTPLQHAAYKGNKEIVQMLLDQGADVNSGKHEHAYTALHFAALSGNAELCHLLLMAGAKSQAVNSVGRTAAQMAAFVGNHACVAVINNHIPRLDIDYYTVPQGLETEPKLQPILAAPLHKFVMQVNVHPVRIALNLQKAPLLGENLDKIRNILELMSEREMKRGIETNEVMAFKFHYLAFVVAEVARCRKRQLAAQQEKKKEEKKDEDKKEGEEKRSDPMELFAKKMLKCGRTSDGSTPEFQENFLRECVREFPYRECTVFRQMVTSLAQQESPPALSVIAAAINGQRGFADTSAVYCSTCGEEGAPKKCSKCKAVQYCDRECQRLHWFMHKKACSRLSQASRELSKPSTTLSSKLENLKVN